LALAYFTTTPRQREFFDARSFDQALTQALADMAWFEKLD
jgi:hypothetical protein